MIEGTRRPRWPGADLPGRRIFVAAPLPERVSSEIAEVVERVRGGGNVDRGRDVRWVRLDGLHLTLRFLGPTVDDRIGAVLDAVRTAGTDGHPFEVTIGGAGTFPSAARPRALWLGLRTGGKDLEDLASAVDRALVGAGWPPESKPFRAHLTLARADGVPAGARVAARLVEASADLRIACPIDRIGLFESLTGGGPARYEPIEVVRLGQG
ncbi:MAG: RNA 2',3'-cyclic phosphodiesterase [Candidatus Limnocylindrales bacterium]